MQSCPPAFTEDPVGVVFSLMRHTRTYKHQELRCETSWRACSTGASLTGITHELPFTKCPATGSHMRIADLSSAEQFVRVDTSRPSVVLANPAETSTKRMAPRQICLPLTSPIPLETVCSNYEGKASPRCR
jgi:hypothetical protein